jgi:RND superfamily putative drug exporter
MVSTDARDGRRVMSAFLERVGRWCARHHWVTIGLWGVAFAALAALAATVGGKPIDNFRLPGSDAQEAIDVLDENFPTESGTSAYVVFHGNDVTADAAHANGIRAAIARTAGIEHVVRVTDPFDPGATSSDRATTRVDVKYDRDLDELDRSTYDDLYRSLAPARDAGLQVEIGGPVAMLDAPSGSTEWIGVLAAMLVLSFVFGSLLAMTLPIGVAIASVAAAQLLLVVFAGVADVPSSTPDLVLMIGLGVALDYSLFIVSRFVDRVRGGEDVIAAVGHAAGTAGVAVVFAGSTVIVAICGLALSGIWAIGVMGFGVALAVAVTVLAALTLLPALLRVLGTHARSSRFRILRGSARREYRGARRWAAVVVRHPVVSAGGALVLLLALATPVLSLRLGQTDDGTAPRSSSERRAFDLLADGFGPGFNGPLLVVADGAGISLPGALDGVREAIAATDGVARVSEPRFNSDGDVAVIEAYPTTAPHASETADLVEHLRNDVMPDVRPDNARVLITGSTAANVDVANELSSRLPTVIATVTFVSFLLLMVAFRSVLVPLKAAIMNLLSIGVGYGVLVAVFQWGWAKDLIGLSETVPIVSWVPLLTFAILFGLSMDYEVFLISSIREAHQRHGDNRQAVVDGLSATARIISAAAFIMLVVFGSFILYPDPTVKMVGLGLAVSVFVDATVVRMVLVPAAMVLLGEANWWLPRWLDRILPTVDLEGEGEDALRLVAAPRDRESEDMRAGAA